MKKIFFILIFTGYTFLNANLYSVSNDGKIHYEQNDIVSAISLDRLTKKIKPSIVIVKKTNCRFFLKWNKTINKTGDKDKIEQLFNDFNVFILDDKKDIVPKELLGEISPSFFLIDEYGVSGEINGHISVEGLLENFVF